MAIIIPASEGVARPSILWLLTTSAWIRTAMRSSPGLIFTAARATWGEKHYPVGGGR